MGFEPFKHIMRGFQGRFGLTESQNSQEIAFVRQLQKEMKTESALSLPLDELNVVVFDVETTGFYPERGDEIISIGAIKISGGMIREDQTFYSLVRYESTLSQEIEELTGISSGELQNAPVLMEVLVQFLQFVDDYTLVAHHANHEKSFLQNAFWRLFRAPFKYRIVDTSFLYRIADPDIKIVSLEDLCDYNRVCIENRHHALGDAKLTAKLWSTYVEKVQKLGCRTLSDVYERIARL